MKSKILVLMIALFLLLSGMLVAVGHKETGTAPSSSGSVDDEDNGVDDEDNPIDLIDSVNVDYHLDSEDAAEEIAEGDLDVLMDRLDSTTYTDLEEEWGDQLDAWSGRGDYKNLLMNPAHEGSGTEPMEEALNESWIDDPEDIQWLANNIEGDWTVNPFAHDDIRFAMQYLNRDEIIEDVRDGFAEPRYGPIEAELEVWKEHFEEEIEEKYGVEPDGDEELMKWAVEEAMEEIQDEVAFGEVTGNMDDGWYYEHEESGTDEHQIEIIILAISEDWRQELGDYLEEILVDQGFDAWVDPTPAGEAIPRAFFGSPEPYDNLDYHIYTGDWTSSKSFYYQETIIPQMYAPWYGFLQTYGEEEHWQYDDEGYDDLIGPSDRIRDELDVWEHADKTIEEMDNTMKQLADEKIKSQIEYEEEYWQDKVASHQMGFEEALRVFLLSELHYYIYDLDAVGSTVTEHINGYDKYFGPRTMEVKEGLLNATILTEWGDRSYTDKWNLYGGSDDTSGEHWRRMLREYGSWSHPETGVPMEVNSYWSDGRETDPYDRQGDIEIDYEYQDGELVENIEISEDAVDYVPGIEDEVVREWYDRDDLIEEGVIDDEYAAVKATIDVHEEHVWHDGTDLSLHDVMANYAREKELADGTSEPYLGSWEEEKSPFYDSIHAIEWNEEAGTYTIYGNYTFPMEDKIGDHYSMFPEVHPLTYEGWDHLHGGEETEYGDIIDETYYYDRIGEYRKIHQIDPEHSEDLVTVLEAMRDDEWIPYYLREENNAPIPMDEDELTTQLDSVIDFIDEYEHSYISAGPLMLEDYDEDDGTMDMIRWDDYGFPFEGEEAEGEEFPHGYWRAQFDMLEDPYFEVEITDYDDEVKETDEVSVQYEVENTGTGQDTQDIVLRVDGNEYDVYEDLTLDPQEDHQGEFIWDETDGPGTYEIEVASEDTYDAAQVNVEEVLELTIDIEGEGTVEVDGEEVEDGWTEKYEEGTEVTITAEPDDGWEFVGWTGDVPEGEEGEEITITIDEDKEITAVFEEEVEETPGFKSVALLLAAVIAVALYRKKKR